jgi:hypothetical protein
MFIIIKLINCIIINIQLINSGLPRARHSLSAPRGARDEGKLARADPGRARLLLIQPELPSSSGTRS